MIRWGSKRIRGEVYDLTHLDPFPLHVQPKAAGGPSYTVRVSFGCHTFTRELTPTDTPDLRFRHANEVRCFCTERHKCSLELPDMIRYAAQGRAYFSERANFLVVETLDGFNAPYVAFFNVEKAHRGDAYDAVMFVTSAHLRPALPNRLPAVTFATLIDYTVQGKKLTRPEPHRIVPVKRK